MSEILLTTLNAKYIHASFGLRYLRANLGPLRERSAIAEFDIKQRPLDIAAQLIARLPRIIGIGVYIWNTRESLELVSLIKKIAPHICVVLGGPEVSYECEMQQIVALADYTITGEADTAFAILCAQILEGKPPAERLIRADLPLPENLVLPYAEYDSDDIAHRVVYVEASRGCPFTCEFCLSSLDVPVRQVSVNRFLPEMQTLLDAGVLRFKFVDRTFNLNLTVSSAILRFFLERMRPGLFVHFEMVPDRLPDALRVLIAQFPPGALQFEVGIQTFNPEVAKLISRRQNYDRLEENLRFLKDHTGVHVHADLIFGLPGETLQSFADGFDRLLSMGPQEIQVGILKRLRGTPIVRHDALWSMVYSDQAPYEILCNRLVPFEEMQRVRRFARIWDVVANSGNFQQTVARIWADERPPFFSFLEFTDWLHAKLGRTDSIPLDTIAAQLCDFLTSKRSMHAESIHELLRADFANAGRTEFPKWLRPKAPIMKERPVRPATLPKRQARHQSAA